MKKEKKSKLNKKDKKQVVNTNTTSADKVTSDKKNQKNVNSEMNKKQIQPEFLENNNSKDITQIIDRKLNAWLDEIDYEEKQIEWLDDDDLDDEQAEWLDEEDTPTKEVHAVPTVQVKSEPKLDSSDHEDSVDNKKPSKKKKGVWIAGALSAALIASYFGMVYMYQDKFMLGTKINGLDCTNLTVEEVEKNLKEKVESYKLSLIFRDGGEETITGESIEYKYLSDNSVQKLMDKQNPFAWVLGIFSPFVYEVNEPVEFDRGLLASCYYELESTADEKLVPPVNAHVSYVEDKFVVVPEDYGNYFNHHELLLDINEAVAAGQNELDVESCDVYDMPTVFSDSKDLEKECEQLNKYARVSITYTLPEGEFVLDGNVVRNWLKVDEQGNYSITDEEMTEAIDNFVDDFAKEIDTSKKPRRFHATKQGDIYVTGGSYGWKIDKAEEKVKITEAIASNAVVTREPIYTSRELTTENNGIGDTYIEIDLTNQHLWYYIDGELYVESDLVSGTYTNKGRRTPGGVYLLTYKQRDRVLRGDRRSDGTYSYESPVKFWMPFNGGIGLHDASWRGKFGGTIYKYSGSHGCINLPYKNAKAIYEKIDKETPIVCFY